MKSNIGFFGYYILYYLLFMAMRHFFGFERAVMVAAAFILAEIMNNE